MKHVKCVCVPPLRSHFGHFLWVSTCNHLVVNVYNYANHPWTYKSVLTGFVCIELLVCSPRLLTSPSSTNVARICFHVSVRKKNIHSELLPESRLSTVVGQKPLTYSDVHRGRERERERERERRTTYRCVIMFNLVNSLTCPIN